MSHFQVNLAGNWFFDCGQVLEERVGINAAPGRPKTA
jgi:hypothetical protein